MFLMKCLIGILKKKLKGFIVQLKKQLNAYWQCVLTEHWLICPEWCKKCGCCKELALFRKELKESWFFSPRTDYNYQPVLQILFFFNENLNLNFRIEIAKTEKSDKIIDQMGRPITRSYIIDLLDQFYINQENNCYFV